ncbi:SEL1-like repeat protein [Arcobacter sp. YIC-310]|uniref:SEL1-like repeat protein n=1 Tax=Arcobacter sp. YIC-310 TaxID=3376632 RepID=UPI003C2468FE
MKNIIFLCLTALFFVSCSSLEPQKIESKDLLIKKANQGDIKAMVSLEKNYNFVNSKEGLFYYEKWYKLIDNKSDKNDVYSLYKIFEEYKYNIANGKIKSKKLLELSKNSKNFEGVYNQIEQLTLQRKRKELQKFFEDNYKSFTNEQLNKVLLFLEKKRYFPRNLDIVTYMKSKNFVLPYDYYFKKMKSDRKNEQKRLESINKQYSFNDKEKLKKSIDYFIYRKDFVNAKRFIDKLKTLNEEDVVINTLYAKLEDKKKYESKEAIKYHKKAAILGNYESSLKLIRFYMKNKDYKSYMDFKEKNKNTISFKKAMGFFYSKKGEYTKAVEYFDKVAQSGDTDTIIALATYTNDRYRFSPEIQKVRNKYQTYILKSDDWKLIEKILDKTTRYGNKKYFKQFNKKLLDKFVEKGKYIQINKFYRRVPNEKDSLNYLIEASKTGDIVSNITLAKYYSSNKKYFNLLKTIEILEKLVHRGEIFAVKILLRFYHKPSYKFKKYEDINKAVKYFDILAKNDDLNAIRSLVRIYMQNEKIKDYKKALYYQKMLAYKTNYREDFRELGALYTLKETQDFKEARKYLNKAIKLGSKKAYLHLGMLHFKDKNYQNNVEEINHKKAFEYFKKAEDYSSTSWYFLGIFYKYGYAVPKDLKKAKFYLGKASAWAVQHAKKESREIEE